DPAAAAFLEESRHALLDARRAQHARIPEFDQHRALGVLGEAPLDAHRAQLVRPASAGPHCCEGFFCSAALISATARSTSSSDIRRKSGSVAVKSCTLVGRSLVGTLDVASARASS